MIFHVENLGPLREAEVDLSKRLIVLTGPNNSGKTYLAWSVYGLFRSPDAREAFRPLVREILASPKQEVDFGRIQALWPAVLDAVAAQLAERLHLCFATVRQTFATVKVELRPAPGEPERRADGDHGMSVAEGISGHVLINGRVAIRFFRLSDFPDSSNSSPITFAEIPKEAHENLFKGLEGLLSWAVLKACWPRCTLFPAERTAVDLFARELSNRRTGLLNEVVEAERS